MKPTVTHTLRAPTFGTTAMRGLPVMLALLASVPTAAQDLLAIRAGKVVTVAGPELTNAVILCENGRITQLGTDIEVPWNATVIDASDKVVMPTYIVAHTDGGLGRGGSNERMENVPFLNVADGIDPSSEFFRESLRNGIGSIHIIPGNGTLLGGIGMVVRPTGRIVEDMAVRERAGLKLSLGSDGGSRVAQIRKLRRALEDAAEVRADFERQRAEFEQEKAAGATEITEFEKKPENDKQIVIDLLEGKIRGFLYLPGPAEVAEVARMKKLYADLDLVLVVDEKCYPAAKQIAALDLPVILEPGAIEFYEKDPITEEETLVSPAKIFADAGIKLAYATSASSSSPARYPWWQQATAVRNGVARPDAMRALTITPAQILGIDGDFGSIEVGKIANLQIINGDPLQATTWVETVILEGAVAYEKKNDRRLQSLFGKDGTD